MSYHVIFLQRGHGDTVSDCDQGSIQLEREGDCVCEDEISKVGIYAPHVPPLSVPKRPTKVRVLIKKNFICSLRLKFCRIFLK